MKKILFITLTFLALFSSCDDYLNLQPIDSLVPDNFYRNASEVDKALNGVYQVLVLKGGAEFLLNSEIMTDNCAYSAASGSIWLDYSRGTLNPSSVFVNKKWSDNYKGIARANLVLDNLYNRKEMVISDSTKIRLMGEAHFLRAYFYTDLMLNYGGVPLIDSPYDNIQQYSIPRSTKQETIDFILKDLNTSIENLAIKPITFGMGRATKGAALFLKSRVLLFTGNYKEANKVLIQLDALHAYSLMTNFADVFDPTKENNAEVVFDIQYANANLDNTSYPYYDYLKSWAGGYCPTVSLAQEFYDIRGLPVDTTRVPFAKFFANRDKRMIATLTRPGDDWGDKVYTPKSTDKKYYNSCMRVRKYLVFSDVTSTAKRSTLNIILFRYADAKLMQAECIIEDDSLFLIDNQRRNAITLLDQIRVRAGLPNIESIISSPTREELREILRRERRVELAFENSRLYDIRRWGIAMTVMNQDALGYDPEMYDKGIYTTYTIDPNRKFNLHNYLWPIPQSEMDANTALTTNNPGY